MTSSETSQITVFAFTTFEEGVESEVVAPFKATREAIVRRFRGRILEGTGQQVDADELDPQGRLARVPTGWGDLPAI